MERKPEVASLCPQCRKKIQAGRSGDGWSRCPQEGPEHLSSESSKL